MSWQTVQTNLNSVVEEKKNEDNKMFGQPAIVQIVSKIKGKTDEEKKEIMRQIESGCMRFDRSGTNALTVDQYYNVIKLQQHVDCTKDDIRKLVADLEMDKEYRVSIKDFMTVPIMSQAVFDEMDKNKDGYVSKGELHLAQRGISMKDLAEILQDLDNDGDGKLTFDEIKNVIRRARKKKAAGGPVVSSQTSTAGSTKSKRSQSQDMKRSNSNPDEKKTKLDEIKKSSSGAKKSSSTSDLKKKYSTSGKSSTKSNKSSSKSKDTKFPILV